MPKIFPMTPRHLAIPAAALALAALVVHAQPASAPVAERAMLRVACDDVSTNAEITINGEFKGECPVDIQVTAGTIKLRAFKKVDDARERIFEQEFRMAADTVKRVNVELSAPQLNARGRLQEQERLRQQEALAAQRAAEERRIALEKEQKEAAEREAAARVVAAELAALEARARAGDTQAMLDIAEKTTAGASGVSAAAWYQQAAAAGHPYPQFLQSGLYRENLSDPAAQALLKVLRKPASPPRNVSIQGTEAIRQFVATDPFFAASGAGATTYRRTQSETVAHERTCQGNGRHFAVEGNINIKNAGMGSRDHSVTGDAALGGLFFVTWKSSRFFESRERVTTEITQLVGQPLPLDASQRFGIAFKLHEKSASWNIDQTQSVNLACGLDPTRKSSRQNTVVLACLVSSNGQPVGYFDAHMNTATGCTFPGSSKGDISGVTF